MEPSTVSFHHCWYTRTPLEYKQENAANDEFKLRRLNLKHDIFRTWSASSLVAHWDHDQTDWEQTVSGITNTWTSTYTHRPTLSNTWVPNSYAVRVLRRSVTPWKPFSPRKIPDWNLWTTTRWSWPKRSCPCATGTARRTKRRSFYSGGFDSAECPKLIRESFSLPISSDRKQRRWNAMSCCARATKRPRVWQR